VPAVSCFSKLEIYQHTRRKRNNQHDIVGVLLLISEDRSFVFLYINLNRELTFLIMELVGLSPDKFSSITMPK
jgi:hypothetical protein